MKVIDFPNNKNNEVAALTASQVKRCRAHFDYLYTNPNFQHEIENIRAAQVVVEMLCQGVSVERVYHTQKGLSEFAYCLVPDEISKMINKQYHAIYQVSEPAQAQISSIVRRRH